MAKNKDNPLTSLLTLFLLTCSLTYISCGASSRGNLIGEAVISIGIVLCILLFIHFYNLTSDTNIWNGRTSIPNGFIYYYYLYLAVIS